MRNKIAFKLSVYFAIALLTFAVIISGMFVLLFRNNTIELHKAELEQRAVKISETLATIMGGSVVKGQGSGYGAYIKFLNDIAMADVWIVDEDLNIITNGLGLHSEYAFTQLPANAESIVNEVFSGKTAFSESFSTLLDTPTLTVGTPIKSSDAKIIGVVLIHSPVTGINDAVSKGIIVLVLSMGVSLVLAILIAIGFSLVFTRPLKKMNAMAMKLADNDYTAKTDIHQNDEIGTLAHNLDILSKRLLLSSEESARLEQMRRDFVANVSHELRTPITVIRGSLEALNDGVVTEESKVKEYYGQMLNESKGLQRLVTDLLDLSRLQNMDFHIEMAQVYICDAVSDVIRSAKSIGESKNIEFIVEKATENCTVTGDYDRLRQMLMTILDNAVKFSPQNGKIAIKLSYDNGLNISIKDQGAGISEEDLPYIFDRFYKTKSVDNTNGTGLGLAIANQIAIRHDAQIRVLSTKGEGSEFIIKFKGEKELNQ
jgi:signal transduction histidine kinase